LDGAERRVEADCNRLAKLREQVAVAVEGDLDGAVAEALFDGQRVGALFDS